jgi:hypothetical protein
MQLCRARSGEKADTEMICGRLTFDVVVSGQLPHPRSLRYEYTTARGSTYALSFLCSRSSEKARLSAGWGETAVGKRRHGCARLGVERETTVDQTLIRGLVTAFRVFVSGLSSV